MKDLWKAAFPVGTEVDQLDTVYDGFNWNFKTLEEAFEEGGMLYGKTVYVFGGAELQLDEDAHKIINVPTVIVIESPVPPSDKLDIGSIQRGMEIIPMKQMGMEWVPYVPSENRDGQVDRMNSQIFSMRCTLTRDALRDMNEDDAKKSSYCRAYFYQPFEESEIEHDAVVDILFPSNPPVVCIFNWELQKLEEFVDGLIQDGELSAEQKNEFKEFVTARVGEAMKVKREAREARLKAIEEMSEETKEAFQNMKFYKFYPQPSPDVPRFQTSSLINRYYGNAHQVL
ncbi:PREDICTED: uncharacterized protein LOC104726224 [Camelina sativa]|uniref:Uncharacterized protein LOC104726224 n=1 Tax=Camelina sativa TaxID=90675 RepID=A0ABM0UMJ1_CAMSA|nr:PREDICTED: uncharacterized protein LOC104726224 [Camelina sativa]